MTFGVVEHTCAYKHSHKNNERNDFIVIYVPDLSVFNAIIDRKEWAKKRVNNGNKTKYNNWCFGLGARAKSNFSHFVRWKNG